MKFLFKLAAVVVPAGLATVYLQTSSIVSQMDIAEARPTQATPVVDSKTPSEIEIESDNTSAVLKKIPAPASGDLMGMELNARFQTLADFKTIRYQTDGQWFEGRQLAWDRHQLMVMLPTGKMKANKWSRLTTLNVSNQPFVAASHGQMKVSLQHEFGSGYRVDQTRDFLVVQPAGSSHPWANRMQQFLGNVQTYFSARRFPISSTKFPMVAVVFPDRETFESHAAAAGESVPKDYRAYYSLMTNRVFLYETQASDSLEIGTVYHEAFHQIAFNANIHFRTASPPRWIAEGMATAFEAPGMYDHRHSGSRRDRIHPYYHRSVANYLSQPDATQDIATLLQDDQAFQANPAKAYCLSWALAFYFMEFQPQAFANYIQRTNQRKPFSDYSGQQRLQDFQMLAPHGIENLTQKLSNFYQDASTR